MRKYDRLLINNTPEDCRPTIQRLNIEPQDNETVTEYIYNCHRCSHFECEYWDEFNV